MRRVSRGIVAGFSARYAQQSVAQRTGEAHRMVVGFPAGSTDIVSADRAQKSEASDNDSGRQPRRAGGVIATEQAAKGRQMVNE